MAVTFESPQALLDFVAKARAGGVLRLDLEADGVHLVAELLPAPPPVLDSQGKPLPEDNPLFDGVGGSDVEPR